MTKPHTMSTPRTVPEAQTVNPPALSSALLAQFINALPLAPAQHAASFLLQSLVRRHGDIFARLRGLGEARFLIDVTDFPIRFVLQPGAVKPAIAILSHREKVPATIATISGNLATLLSLLQGKVDGDALFFTRALSIQGDMAAVLCLRNALDGAEIDLVSDIAGRFGLAAELARQALSFHTRMRRVAEQRLSRLQVALPVPLCHRMSRQEGQSPHTVRQAADTQKTRQSAFQQQRIHYD